MQPVLQEVHGPRPNPEPHLDDRPAGEASPNLPALIAEAGDQAGRRFVEFFAAQIRNTNTRSAYAQTVVQFLRWCEERKLTLQTIQPVAVAASIEQLSERRSAPTDKQHLAAIKILLDWIVTGHIIEVNPAASVRLGRGA